MATLTEVLTERQQRYNDQADAHDASAAVQRAKASDIGKVLAKVPSLTSGEQEALLKLLAGDF
jgi:hypothetical protein